MTKLHWEKADRYEPDPGAVIEVSERVRPCPPFVSKQERQAKRAIEMKELLERSERKRLKAVAQKQARLAARHAARAQHKPVEKPE